MRRESRLIKFGREGELLKTAGDIDLIMMHTKRCIRPLLGRAASFAGARIFSQGQAPGPGPKLLPIGPTSQAYLSLKN